MKINQHLRPVRQIVEIQASINLNPAWQRGAVWSTQKQVLLIDSILRGMDLPKLYLLQRGEGAPYSFEAVDGQQRLRAIFLFKANQLSLIGREDLLAIDGEEVNGKRYENLSQTLRDRFDEFLLSVAEIEPTDHDSVRRLFLRLQMGVNLNPAELRNAMPGPLRHMIDLIATTSPFFDTCGIPDNRYKRQDYLAHVFTLLGADSPLTLKAQEIQRAYEEMPATMIDELAPRIAEVLDLLDQVNGLSPYRITQKWVFVDLCWFVADHLAQGRSVSAARLAQAYTQFEQRRRDYTRHPEELLRKKPAPRDRAFYSYLVAFKTSGAERANVAARRAALDIILGDLEVVS